MDELKMKSISQMTMVELLALNDRLDAECRAQRAVLELKQNSGERWNYDNRPAIDTVTPINQLYHHGILGQKWGVRRTPNSVTTAGAKSKSSTIKKKTETETEEEKPKSEDFMSSRILKSKAVAGLSNVELKQLNDRLNLEKQYKDLTKDEQQKGKNFLSDSVSSGLKQTASTVVAASSLYAVKKLIEKSLGDSVTNEMFPKKK